MISAIIHNKIFGHGSTFASQRAFLRIYLLILEELINKERIELIK